MAAVIYSLLKSLRGNPTGGWREPRSLFQILNLLLLLLPSSSEGNQINIDHKITR